MSNAIVPVVPKRNAVTGASYPTSLTLGELAVNTTTGNVYLGADPGVVRIGIPVAAGTTLNLGTGNGSTVAFTITGGTGTDAGGYLVSVGGIDQPGGWTVAGTTLTFSEAPPSGAAVSVRAILKGEGGGGGGTDIGGRAWAAGSTYTQGDLVATSQRETWICIQNANTGNDPATSPTWWAPQPADAVSLQLRAVAVTTPVAGQILAWRNNAWTPWGHMYAHSIYWSDDQTLSNGSYLWTANFTDAVAANVNFIEGAYTITTDSNGLVTKALTQNWYDDSSDLHQTVSLISAISQGDEGAGVKFANLSTGYFSISLAQAIGNNDFTIECFAQFTADNGVDVLFGLGPSNQAGHVNAGTTSGSLTPFLSVGSTSIDTSTLSLNTWYHVAVAYQNGGNVVLYINGIARLTANPADVNATNFYLGANPAAPASEHFTGKIASFRFVNGTAVYTADFTPPTLLLTAISGTQLLLNFEATAVPTV